MKDLTTTSRCLKLMPILLLVVLLGYSGCKKDDEPTLTEQQIATAELAKTWDVFNNGTVLRDNTDVTSDYPGFVITFGDNTYTSSGGGDIWKPTSAGAWQFANETTVSEIIIKGKSIDLTISSNSLNITFDVLDEDDGVGRTESIQGEYAIIVRQ